MSKGDYLETALLNWVRGTAMPAPPAAVHVSLHTADPGETGANEHGATAGYARRPVTFTDPPSPISNSAVVEFPQATADYSAPITHFGVWDAATAGNFFGGGALTSSRTIRNGDIPRFAVGALTWDET